MPNDLAALVGSRICHDLISPIGAISNGVELLTLSAPSETEEMSLIGQSVQNASARVLFFRIAYGAASADQLISSSEVLGVLKEIAENGRFSYALQCQQSLSRQEVRIVFLLIQCLETSLPLGGNIDIAKDGERWVLTGEGRQVQINDTMWASLSSRSSDVSYNSAQVQFALLPAALADARRVVSFDVNNNRITVRC